MNGFEIVGDYGDVSAEHAAFTRAAGVLDLSCRTRLCLVGADRVRFLHGQVTNDIKKLRVGEGCYAAITNAKGKMEGDANIFRLAEELLLDGEPGLAEKITRRLEKYLVADEVQIVDAAPHYGLLTVQGPKAEAVIRATGLTAQIPAQPLASVNVADAALGEIILVTHARLAPVQSAQSGGSTANPVAQTSKSAVARVSKPADIAPVRRSADLEIGDTAGLETCATTVLRASAQDPSAPGLAGFDLLIPTAALGVVWEKLRTAAASVGGRACGWRAFDLARIEAGIPRYGVDMDETSLPLECGLETRAITYTKGCYIGQEVINRIHSVGHVNRELRGLRLADDLPQLPERGAKLFHGGKEAGFVTSAAQSPRLRANIALACVRCEAGQVGGELTLQTAAGESRVRIVELPFF